MLTLDDLRAVGKLRESEGTTVGTSPSRGGKYSIPDSPFPVPNSPFPTLFASTSARLGITATLLNPSSCYLSS